MISVISVPVQTSVFLSLADFLKDNGDSRDPASCVNIAIEYWIKNQRPKSSATLTARSDAHGYRWKSLFLPHGTSLRMKYRNTFHYANVEMDEIVFAGGPVSPSGFVAAVTHSSRNAWRDIEVKLPGSGKWLLANDLRTKDMQTSTPLQSTWLEDVVTALENLGTPSPLGVIYKEVRNIRRSRRRSEPPSLEAITRRTLEESCSDSQAYRFDNDLFAMPEGKGAGIWSLR